MRSKQMCPSGAKGYYEIKVLAKDHASMYGFASMGFKRVGVMMFIPGR